MASIAPRLAILPLLVPGLASGLGCVLVDNPDYVGTTVSDGAESESGTGDTQGDGDGDSGDGDGDGDSGDGDGDGDSGDGDGDTATDDPAIELWCEDLDMDGVGGDSCVEVALGEDGPPGYVLGGGDCLDDNPAVYPGAAAMEPELCTVDADEDDWGDISAATVFPGAEDGNDCDDANPDIVVCADTSPSCVDGMDGMAQLYAEGVGGDGNYSYEWSPPEDLDDALISNPIALVSGDASYTVVVSDGLGNLGQGTFEVLANDPWPLDAPGCETFGLLGPAAGQDLGLNPSSICTTDSQTPTAHVCPKTYSSARLTTFLEVETGPEPNVIGLVWGWQNPDQFYVLSWKRATQGWYNCAGQAGITVKRVDRQEAYTPQDFACEADTPNATTLLDPSQTTTDGWVNLHSYSIELVYEPSQTAITITDTLDMVEVASFVVMDDTYPSGQAGSYSFNQSQACVGPWTAACL